MRSLSVATVVATVLSGGIALPALARPADIIKPSSEEIDQRAAPSQAPILAPDASVPAPVLAQTPAAAGDLLVNDVAVTVEPDNVQPRPNDKWHPSPTDATGLQLVHEYAESLDAPWVKRQFSANGMIGTRVGYDRIAALLQIINLAYVRNGYINTGVVLLPQPLGSGDGVLRLQLIFGHLANGAGGSPVTIEWRNGRREGLSSRYIENRMPAARALPFNIAAIEQDFRLLADDAAIRTINADVRPGGRPGEATLVVTVDPQPRLDLYTDFSNSRSPSVGGDRIAAGGSIRSTLTSGDLVSAEVGSTKGLTDFFGSYTTPFLARGLALTVRGGFDDAAVVDRPLLPLDIHSRKWSVEGGISQTVIARPLTPLVKPGMWVPAESLILGAFIAHHRLTSTLLGVPFSFSPGADNGRTEYTAVRLSAAYTRRSVKSVFAVSFTGSVGLEGTRPDDRSIPHPSQNFTAGLLQVNYARLLNSEGLELRLRFAGQLAGGLLYSPERFSVGGNYTVRGYRENLILADDAAVGSVELAQPISLSAGGSSQGANWRSFALSVFADAGVAHNRVRPQPQPDSVASIGTGLTWTPAPWLFVRATYAKALKHVATLGRRSLQDRGFAFRIVFHPLPLLWGGR